MTSINKNNYQAFFLDYHEGNLSTSQVAELMAFLDINPYLREEFENFENLSFNSGNEFVFEGKESLKRENINKENYEEYLIRFVEKDLSENEIILLKVFINQNPAYNQEFELYKKTILVPEKIVFEEKEKLKKKSRIIYYWAAAASIFIILTLFFLFQKPHTNTLVVQEKNKVETKKGIWKVEKLLKIDNKKPNEIIPNIERKEKKSIPKNNSNQKNESVLLTENIAKNDSIIKTEKNELQVFVELDKGSAIIPVSNSDILMNDSVGYTLLVPNFEQDTVIHYGSKIISRITNPAFRELIADSKNKKKSPKQKFLVFASKVIKRITNDRIQLNTIYNDKQELASYSITAKKFNFYKKIKSEETAVTKMQP